MNKRDAILSLLDDSQQPSTIPAAFFLHFPPEFHAGQAAVDKHSEYFHYTGMDLVKIQFERRFPQIGRHSEAGGLGQGAAAGGGLFRGPA